MVKKVKEGKLEYYQIDDEKLFTQKEIEEAQRNLEMLEEMMEERRIKAGSFAKYVGEERPKNFLNEAVANHYLKNGNEYKVKRVDEGDYVTFIELEEYPGVMFNSIDFLPVKN